MSYHSLFVAPPSGWLDDRAAGDTRTPFVARFVGAFGFMLGGSYLLGIVLGYGLPGIYLALVLSFACWAAVAGAGFLWGGWTETAASMIAERAAAHEDDP